MLQEFAFLLGRGSNHEVRAPRACAGRGIGPLSLPTTEESRIERSAEFLSFSCGPKPVAMIAAILSSIDSILGHGGPSSVIPSTDSNKKLPGTVL